MFTKLGIYSVLIGFFVGVFTGISRFMKADNFWIDLTISKLTGDYSDRIVTAIPLDFMEKGLNFLVYEMPLSLGLVGLGLIFFIIAAIVKEY